MTHFLQGSLCGYHKARKSEEKNALKAVCAKRQI